MAKSYKNYLKPQVDSLTFGLNASASIAIPPQSSFSFFADVAPGAMSVVEGALVYMDFVTPSMQCNQVELVSPAGTKSILLNAGAGFTNLRVNAVRLASNAFYGESTAGRWVVTYRNLCGSSLEPTVLPIGSVQQLLIVGR